MRLLDRYILRAICGGVALVMAVLGILGMLFLFIGQQDDIGVGRYTLGSAVTYTLLNLPQTLWDLLPIGVLVGAMLGLGDLARGSEFTVMRAAGVSVWRIAMSTAFAGLLLAALSALLGEVVVPPMLAYAQQQKALAKFDNVSFAGSAGAWVRDGNRLLNVEQQGADGKYGGMTVYELSTDHRLASVGHAMTASGDRDGKWRLSQFGETRFAAQRVTATRERERVLDASLSAKFLGVAVTDPDHLAAVTLWPLIQNMQANGLALRPQLYAFWSRIARTVAVVFAALLAVPFMFGSLRASGAGAKTMVGLLLGVAFFLLQRVLEGGALVFDQFNPVLVAWLPTALLATASLVLVARTR